MGQFNLESKLRGETKQGRICICAITKNKKSTLRRKSSQLGTTIFIEGGRGNSDVVHVLMCQTKRNPVMVAMPSTLVYLHRAMYQQRRRSEEL